MNATTTHENVESSFFFGACATFFSGRVASRAASVIGGFCALSNRNFHSSCGKKAEWLPPTFADTPLRLGRLQAEQAIYISLLSYKIVGCTHKFR